MISSNSRVTSLPPKRIKFLFLQVLLLSSYYLPTESRSHPSNVYTRDTVPRSDLPSISLNLRVPNKVGVTTKNATNYNGIKNSSSSMLEEGGQRHLGETDLYQTPIVVPNDDAADNDKNQPKRKENMFRIIGGSNHHSSGMPSFAMLATKINGNYYYAGCGGSLISPCHVLTAAHCADDPDKIAGMAIYINAYTPWRDNGGLPNHFTTIQGYNIHPQYENYGYSRPLNDVAVLTLAQCVDENEEDKDLFLHNIMELATLSDWNRLSNQAALKVSGFGSTTVTSVGSKTQDYSDALQTVSVPYHQHCDRQGFYEPGMIVDNDMMCAGRSGRDACFGDSGGPLYHEYSSTASRHPRHKQFGIVSWGHGCGQPNKPGVYASVAHHYDFIKKVVCTNANVQLMDWGSGGTSNLCGVRKATPSPTPPPTPRPTPKPVTPRNTPYPAFPYPSAQPSSEPSFEPSQLPSSNPSGSPSSKPSDSPSSAPTTPPVLSFENPDGSFTTTERKNRLDNDKNDQKLSGSTTVSSDLTKIRGGSANNLNYSQTSNGGRSRLRRQLGASPDGPEEVF